MEAPRPSVCEQSQVSFAASLFGGGNRYVGLNVNTRQRLQLLVAPTSDDWLSGKIEQGSAGSCHHTEHRRSNAGPSRGAECRCSIMTALCLNKDSGNLPAESAGSCLSSTRSAPSSSTSRRHETSASRADAAPAIEFKQALRDRPTIIVGFPRGVMFISIAPYRS